MEANLKEMAVTLYDIQALKFGDFKTKVGLRTPVYFDLRVIISYPKFMSKLAKVLWTLRDDTTKVSKICGVPYTALPLATVISVENDIPMVMKRKEAKTHGTKKLIEGAFSPGENCVIIEDVITSGSSILETVDALTKEGLDVTEAYVVIDREQGGRENLENCGIKVKSLYKIKQLMQYLLEAGKVTPEVVQSVNNYLAINRAPNLSIQGVLDDRLKMPYCKRAKLTKNPLTSELLELMESKQSNLCLAVDFKKADTILELAFIAGPHIAVLKTHVDIIEDFSDDFVLRLRKLAKEHKFLLMEDRKFADIGNTVSLQYRHGLYKIAEWADLITAHPVSGASIIDALRNGLKDVTEPRGIFLIAEMSSKGALTTGDYLKSAVSMAEDASDLVVGLVCVSNLLSGQPGLLQMTPGIKLSKGGDHLGQQYNDPESVINAGTDLAVVGRGITEASNWLETTLEYKKRLWEAYEKRIKARAV